VRISASSLGVFFFGGEMENFFRRSKMKTTAADPEPEWTPQMYLDHAKANRMLADFELGEAIDALNRFDAKHPSLVNIDGQTAAFFYPELRKPFAARKNQAHAALMEAIAHEDVMRQRYAPSKESRWIGGVRVQ
jgi:hypothetical protein